MFFKAKILMFFLCLASLEVNSATAPATVSAAAFSNNAASSSSGSHRDRVDNYGYYREWLKSMKESKLCEHGDNYLGVHKTLGKLTVSMLGSERVLVVGSNRQNYYLSAFEDVDCDAFDEF